jgi:PAS domain S-box-containing protein
MENNKQMEKIEILIIEDSLTQAEELKFILEEHQYSVTHAVNGEIGLQMLLNFTPDIIISDIMMPGMDGYTFCSTVKSTEAYKKIPVILLTSLSDPRDVIKGLECGADSFLTKPYNEDFLISRIHYFLQNANLRSAQTSDTSQEVLYANQRYTILSSSRQILDILLSTYEDSIRKNEELIEINLKLKAAHDSLSKLNSSLEIAIRARTKELEDTNKKLLDEVIERKQLSEELQRAQVMLKSSLESPKDMNILSIDKNYRYLYFNKPYKKMMKKVYKSDTQIGVNVLECISSEEDRIKAKINFDQSISGKSHSKIEEYFDKEKRYYESFYNPTIDQNNEIIGITVFSRDITERKRIELALKENEEKYRSMVDHSPDTVIIHSEGKIVFANPAALTLMGAKNYDQLLNHEVINFIHPNYRDLETTRIRQLSKTQQPVGFVHEKLIQLTNNIIDTELIDIPLNYLGKPSIQTIIRDISDRIKTEEALRESEKQYRNLFNKMEEGFAMHEIICDQNGIPCDYKFLEINPAFEILTGLEASQVKGKTVLELLPETETYWIETYGKVALTGQPGHFESYSRAIGKYFHVMAYCPAPNQFATFFYDVTEQKNAELKLLESNEFNQSLLRTIPFGMDIVDEDGNILFFSDNLANAFGNNSLGKKCWNLYCDNRTKCFDCPLPSGIQIGKTSILETNNFLGNRTFQISHTGMMFKGKKTILEIFQDITERKQDEKELIRAKVRAEESDRLKSSFLANMSHEIRTPLNSIIGFSELLTDPEIDTSSQNEFAQLINSNGNQLLSIINDIIDISKIESGQVEIKYSKIDLNCLFSCLLKEFSFKASERGLDFRVSALETNTPTIIEGDEVKLRQIITNFIGNALKFTPRGFIEIGYKEEEQYIQFHIKDTGIGIPEDFREKIFERFCQVDSGYTRKYGGNGLGLPISRSLIELMGGKLWLESETDKGSTFYFSIPKKSEKEDSSQ